MTPAKLQAGSPVYCCGPMFSKPDLSQQLRIARALEGAGFSTYVPQRDGIEVARVMNNIRKPLFHDLDTAVLVMETARKLVFALDIFQLLDRCGAVVFNLDGRVPDDGSVMEAAVGWTANRPVVLFKTTSITMLGGYDNPMVSGLGERWSFVHDLKDLAPEVKRAVAVDQSLEGQPFVPGPHAAAVIALGAQVWTLLPAIRQMSRLRTPAKILQAVQGLKAELASYLDAAGLS